MDLTKMIVDRLESNDVAIREMAKAVSDLAQAVAKKEVSDQHFNEAIKQLRADVSALSHAHVELEKRFIEQWGGKSIGKTAINSVVQFIVLTVCGGILWAIVQSYKGG